MAYKSPDGREFVNMQSFVDALTAEHKATLAALETERSNRAGTAARATIQIGNTRNVEVYLPGSKFPFAAHKDMWAKLCAVIPDIQGFIATHDSELPTLREWLSSPEKATRDQARKAKIEGR